MPDAGTARGRDDARRDDGWKSLNQYKNPANPEAHFRTTGPEIWRQTGGAITHFVAGLGTCGTITGTGRFLKAQNPAIKVLGAHPTEGHDIPGVRSRRALALTDFFRPEEYDGVFEITDAEAYGLNARLIQEESIIAGPTCAMALAAAFKAVPDEPGNLVVVVFPDNAFKYITSYPKHLPHLFPERRPPPAALPFAEQLQAIVALAEVGSDVVVAQTAKALIDGGATLLDVRNPDEIAKVRVPGSVDVPLGALTDGERGGLPSDRSLPVVTMCAKGRRSIYAQLLLKAQGYQNVKSLFGGIGAWEDEGLPVARG